MVNLQEKSQAANILPASEVILQKLRLDSKQVKLIKPFEKRERYARIVHPNHNYTLRVNRSAERLEKMRRSSKYVKSAALFLVRTAITPRGWLTIT